MFLCPLFFLVEPSFACVFPPLFIFHAIRHDCLRCLVNADSARRREKGEPRSRTRGVKKGSWGMPSSSSVIASPDAAAAAASITSKEATTYSSARGCCRSPPSRRLRQRRARRRCEAPWRVCAAEVKEKERKRERKRAGARWKRERREKEEKKEVRAKNCRRLSFVKVVGLRLFLSSPLEDLRSPFSLLSHVKKSHAPPRPRQALHCPSQSGSVL